MLSRWRQISALCVSLCRPRAKGLNPQLSLLVVQLLAECVQGKIS